MSNSPNGTKPSQNRRKLPSEGVMNIDSTTEVRQPAGSNLKDDFAQGKISSDPASPKKGWFPLASQLSSAAVEDLDNVVNRLLSVRPGTPIPEDSGSDDYGMINNPPRIATHLGNRTALAGSTSGCDHGRIHHPEVDPIHRLNRLRAPPLRETGATQKPVRSQQPMRFQHVDHSLAKSHPSEVLSSPTQKGYWLSSGTNENQQEYGRGDSLQARHNTRDQFQKRRDTRTRQWPEEQSEPMPRLESQLPTPQSQGGTRFYHDPRASLKASPFQAGESPESVQVLRDSRGSPSTKGRPQKPFGDQVSATQEILIHDTRVKQTYRLRHKVNDRARQECAEALTAYQTARRKDICQRYGITTSRYIACGLSVDRFDQGFRPTTDIYMAGYMSYMVDASDWCSLHRHFYALRSKSGKPPITIPAPRAAIHKCPRDPVPGSRMDDLPTFVKVNGEMIPLLSKPKATSAPYEDFTVIEDGMHRMTLHNKSSKNSDESVKGATGHVQTETPHKLWTVTGKGDRRSTPKTKARSQTSKSDSRMEKLPRKFGVHRMYVSVKPAIWKREERVKKVVRYYEHQRMWRQQRNEYHEKRLQAPRQGTSASQVLREGTKYAGGQKHGVPSGGDDNEPQPKRLAIGRKRGRVEILKRHSQRIKRTNPVFESRSRVQPNAGPSAGTKRRGAPTLEEGQRQAKKQTTKASVKNEAV